MTVHVREIHPRTRTEQAGSAAPTARLGAAAAALRTAGTPRAARADGATRTTSGESRTRGHTLIELIAVLALAAITTAALIGGFDELRRESQLIAARQRLALALEQGRRIAYLRATTAHVSAAPGDNAIVVSADAEPPRAVVLPGNAIVSAAPARREARFFASGFADNATFEVTTPNGRSARVVVDQRGEIE